MRPVEPMFPQTVSRHLGIMLLALAFATPHVANAQFGFHILDLTPRIGQRGETVDVTIQGRGLKDAKELVFYGSGIRCLSMEPLPDLERSLYGRRFPERLRCRLEISPDCPVGEHYLRVRTAAELTSLRTFNVSPFPVIDEDEDSPHANDSPATAKRISAEQFLAGVSIQGQIDRGSEDDIDVYRVPVVAGGRVTVEVDSVRIAETMGHMSIDLAVRLLDEQGTELAANDENPLAVQDPIVSIRAPYTGDLFVEVRRTLFCDDVSTYVVHIGSFRRPLAAYPAGGLAGQPLRVELFGDPLGKATETVVVPDEPGDFTYFGDASSPLRMRSSRMPNVLEDPAALETPVQHLPAALNGVLSKDGERDRFRLKVDKDERLKIRVISAGLGLAVDPAISLRPVAHDGTPGPVEVYADDAPLEHHDIYGVAARDGGGLPDKLDPALIWTPKTTGDYVLEIRDVDGGGGPQSIYRIEIESPRDAIHCQLLSTAYFRQECMRTTGLVIPRGERCTVVLSLPEGLGNTYRGDLEIVAHGLPMGVSLTPTHVPGGQRKWPIQLVADQTASNCSAMVTFEARPTEAGRLLDSLSLQTFPFALYADEAWRIERLGQFVVAVTDPAPFSVEVEVPAVPLIRSGELTVPVRIHRKPGFDGPIQCECQWVPTGLGVPPATLVPARDERVNLGISAEANAPLGSVPFAVIATSTKEPSDENSLMGIQQIKVSSEFVTIRVAESFVAASSPPTSIRRGGRTTYRWSVEQKEPFEGEATVRLLGLPKGLAVHEPFPTITKESKELSFTLEASREALVGLVRNLACEVIVTAGDQTIRQRTGDGTLRIDPELVAEGDNP